MKFRLISACLGWLVLAAAAHAQHPEAPSHPPAETTRAADVTTHHVLEVPGRTLRFAATAGTIRLRDSSDAPVADVGFVAYQQENADTASRPVTFVFNGGPGMASAWLQMGAIGPWRVRLQGHSDGPSTPAVPVPNAETWLDFTDLVFIDPPGTGYSRILATDADTRRRLWSVGGDIEALATTVRQWLDQSSRNISPKYILGESYGGFRGPRLVRELASDQGVGISGLILLSPLLDTHDESGYADPLSWADLLPSQVAVVRAAHGPVARADLADVEAYADGDYLTDMLKGPGDAMAIERLTTRVAALTGFDPALVRRMGGRLGAGLFQQTVAPGQVVSAYDGTVSRANPTPRSLDSRFPDPVLDGYDAPVTSAMMAIYAGKLNWRPDAVYHLSNDAVFGAWDWGRGMGRPESLTALQAARSLDPHLRVLIAHGLFDLRTPYAGTARMLRLLPVLDGSPPVALRVYPGGHMFYFNDASRADLRNDAKAVFDPPETEKGSP